MNDKFDNNQFLHGETEKSAFYGYTCIGGRTEDQDCLAYDNVHGRQIFVVCDGMGGHAGGCIASTTAAKFLTDALKRQVEIVPTKEAIITAVNEANSAVYKKSQEEPSLRGMGTTLTLLVIDSQAAYVTHIGDSRIYQLRKGKKLFRTFDNSQVFEQVAKRKMTEEEARVHPRANILTKALGILPDVDFTVTKLDYNKNDRFILCCDGVWNTQPEKELLSMFTTDENLETTILTTQSIVEKIGKENGGQHDNHTMIAVDMKNYSKYRKSFFTKIANFFNKCI
ncbi:MAG: serine/threonine-protein phosphatase [Prevotella sp.]|nr:serine/threonine-protein phosphatase [Prevotella sp.]